MSFRFQEPPPRNHNLRIFREDWLNDSSPYKSWLAKSAFDTEAYCKLCKTNVCLWGIGEDALRRHDESKMHNLFRDERTESIAAVQMRLAAPQTAGTSDDSTAVMLSQPSTSFATCVNDSVRVMEPSIYDIKAFFDIDINNCWNS